MSKPVTPESLRAEAATYLAEAKILRDKAEHAEAAAQERLGLASQIERMQSGLSPGPDSATIAAMEANQNAATAENRRIGRRISSTGPVAAIAKTLGITITEVGKRAGFKAGSVRSWDARGKIPDDAQPKFDALLREHAALQSQKKTTKGSK